MALTKSYFFAASGLAIYVVILLVFHQRFVDWSVWRVSGSQTQDAMASLRRSFQPRSSKTRFSARQGDDKSQEGHPSSFPPLESLIRGTSIVSNVEFLLDFAVIGHAKTGTWLFLNWLRSSNHIRMHEKEVHALTDLDPVQMVKFLLELPAGGLHGYKAPRDVCDPNVLDMIATYWPRAKLIIGLRHPVHWFESFYNYRYATEGDRMPHASALIGECMQDIVAHRVRAMRKKQLNRTRHEQAEDFGVCTDLARFHVHLSYLGKTNVSEPRQMKLLGPKRHWSWDTMPHVKVTNPVFIYEASQLSPSDPESQERFSAFRVDLETFLNLPPRSLGPPPSRASKEANYNPVRKHPLDICRDEYKLLRAELVRHGAASATWIVDYFMGHPDVTVSSPDYFRTLLKSWHVDPCSR
jgi:hypothetical protein